MKLTLFVVFVFCCVSYSSGVGNNAKFQSCTQSSTRDWKCQLAMDGQHKVCYWGTSSHTKKELKSWWKGELAVKTNIGKVRIVGRKDDLKTLNRLHNFKIILDGEKMCAEYNQFKRVLDQTFDCMGVSKTVKVQLNEKNYLSLCEVIVYKQDNTLSRRRLSSSSSSNDVAKFQSCTQSSTRHWKCQLAMDGQHKVCYWGTSSHTKKELKSWWKGELAVKTNIAKVRIVGRKDDRKTLNRLHNFKIILDGEKMCAEYNQFKRVLDQTFDCVGVSKTVKVQLNEKNYLSLCEVIVYKQDYALSRSRTSSSSNDVVKFRTCTQSSTYHGHQCTQAIDSQTRVCTWRQSTHTKKELKSWWKGELAVKTNIGKVRIVGRKDGLTKINRLNNFKIILDGGKVCAEYKPKTRLLDHTFDCVGVSKTVKVQLNGNNYLSLCEVIVYKQAKKYLPKIKSLKARKKIVATATTKAPVTTTIKLPTRKLPTTKLPTTKLPTRKLPTTKLPTRKLPTTKLPTTKLPTRKLPTTKLPTTKLPITKLPTTKLPTTKLPTTKLPTTKLPITKLPTTKLPTTKLPTTKLPTTKLPTTKLPITKLPTTKLTATTLTKPKVTCSSGWKEVKGGCYQQLTQRYSYEEAVKACRNKGARLVSHNQSYSALPLLINHYYVAWFRQEAENGNCMCVINTHFYKSNAGVSKQKGHPGTRERKTPCAKKLRAICVKLTTC